MILYHKLLMFMVTSNKLFRQHVPRAIRRYLSEIGCRGGKKSRRTLSTETARDMVRVREARRAFRHFRTQCFWWCDPTWRVTLDDVPWIIEQLQRHGDRRAWMVAMRLCR